MNVVEAAGQWEEAGGLLGQIGTGDVDAHIHRILVALGVALRTPVDRLVAGFQQPVVLDGRQSSPRHRSEARLCEPCL